MDIWHIFLETHYEFLTFITNEFKVFSFSSLTFVLMLPAFIVLFFYILSRNFKCLPDFIQTAVEMIYFGMYDFVAPYCQGYEAKYAKYIVALFFYLLFLNLLNLVPFLSDTTSQIFINLTISCAAILFLLFINIYEHGFYFYHQFIVDVPNFIKPFLFIMEFSLFLLKIFTLALRLSIAIGIGHLLLNIMANLDIAIFGSSLIIFVLSSIITLIEISVACLQAYIFTLFICLSASDMLRKH